MFHHVNWTWAPPGTKGNMCERCGTNCFCVAEAGLLPKTRAAAKNIANADSDGVYVAPAVLPDGLAAIMLYDSD